MGAMTAPLIIYGMIIVALTWAEYRRWRRWQYWLKPLAALGFILLALMSGALYSPYGVLILWALIFCAIGDVCLLPRNRPNMFLLGMAVFAIGHIIYMFAFHHLGINMTIMALTAVILSGFVFRCSDYVLPNLDKDNRFRILIYSFIISFMIAFALATKDIWIILPAIMFAVSDIFVARDRFVKNEPVNALLITPLYFGAQALFALNAFT